MASWVNRVAGRSGDSHGSAITPGRARGVTDTGGCNVQPNITIWLSRLLITTYLLSRVEGSHDSEGDQQKISHMIYLKWKSYAKSLLKYSIPEFHLSVFVCTYVRKKSLWSTFHISVFCQLHSNSRDFFDSVEKSDKLWCSKYKEKLYMSWNICGTQLQSMNMSSLKNSAQRPN